MIKKSILVVLGLLVSNSVMSSEKSFLVSKLNEWSSSQGRTDWIAGLPNESIVKTRRSELGDEESNLNLLIHKTRSNLVTSLKLKPFSRAEESIVLSAITWRLQESCNELCSKLKDLFNDEGIAENEMGYMLTLIQDSLEKENIDLFS